MKCKKCGRGDFDLCHSHWFVEGLCPFCAFKEELKYNWIHDMPCYIHRKGEFPSDVPLYCREKLANEALEEFKIEEKKLRKRY